MSKQYNRKLHAMTHFVGAKDYNVCCGSCTKLIMTLQFYLLLSFTRMVSWYSEVNSNQWRLKIIFWDHTLHVTLIRPKNPQV